MRDVCDGWVYRGVAKFAIACVMAIERYQYYRPHRARQQAALSHRQTVTPPRVSWHAVFAVVAVCGVLGVGWLIAVWWHAHDAVEDVPSADATVASQDTPTTGDTSAQASATEHVTTYTIAEGDIPAEVFAREGHLDANDIAQLLAASADIFDLTKLKIGQPMRFRADATTGDTVRVEYDCDTESTVVAERTQDGFTVHKDPIAYDVTEEVVAGTIANFFYVDALDAGLTEPTIVTVGDVFSFSFDFMTDIRVGDTFAVVYEKRLRDGARGPDGAVMAARFVNDGATHEAYYFVQDGAGAYYDGEGHKLERQFLQAPLNYRRITSGFTGARMHPITKRVSAHYQIDYAAPTGTPVVATANGIVTSAGWEGGWGNMVRLTHDNGYTTHYGHLSGIAKGVARGAHVSRGEVIGFVGSTGWSTGPHLDYGMKKDGTPVNPMHLEQPKGAPLEGEAREAFFRQKERYAQMLAR